MSGEERKQVQQSGRETCYFCESDGPIETHHIVPKRYDGTDHDSNLVDLCPTCHRRLERLYDDEFYGRIGAGKRSEQVQVILEAVAESLEGHADDSRWLADSLRDTYVDVDVGEACQRAVEDLINEDDGLVDAEDWEEYRSNNLTVREIVKDLEADYEAGAPIQEVFDVLLDFGIKREIVEQELQKLRQRGEVYEPASGHLRTT